MRWGDGVDRRGGAAARLEIKGWSIPSAAKAKGRI